MPDVTDPPTPNTTHRRPVITEAPMTTTRPPFQYYGGKTRLAKRIAALLPAHKHYVEPFAGSLAVLLAKQPTEMETVNDLDESLVTFWRVLRDRPDDLIRVCSLTPHSRVEHREAYDLDIPDDLERARRVWVALSQSRGGSLRRSGWRYRQNPAVPHLSMSGYIAAYVERMNVAADRLLNVSLECRPALDVIIGYGKHDEVCIYADPPYLANSRSSLEYTHEMGSDSEHEELADALKRCRASVVISGYRSPLYDRLYAGWHVHELAASSGRAGNVNISRVEALWSNRELNLPSGWTRADDGTAVRS